MSILNALLGGAHGLGRGLQAQQKFKTDQADRSWVNEDRQSQTALRNQQAEAARRQSAMDAQMDTPEFQELLTGAVSGHQPSVAKVLVMSRGSERAGEIASLLNRPKVRDPVADHEAMRKVDIANPVASTSAPPRNPVADHEANRRFDIANPLPPAATGAGDFEKKADFMLEGTRQAVATLEGYAPKPRAWISKIPGAGNYGLTDENQVAQSAAEALHDAYLRLTTGASIAPNELSRAAKQYIAQPGDGDAVRKYKQTRRAQVLRAIETAAATVRRPGAPTPTDTTTAKYSPDNPFARRP